MSDLDRIVERFLGQGTLRGPLRSAVGTMSGTGIGGLHRPPGRSGYGLPSWRRTLRRPVFLMLDYDGTLVGLRARPDRVRSTKRLVTILRALAAHPQIRVVMVSGRRADQLSRLLPVEGLTYFGAYGAQVKLPGGPIRWNARVRSCRPAIRRLFAALAADLRAFRGIVLEDKWGCIGIQTRTLSREDRAEVVHRVRRLVSTADGGRILQATENAYGVEVGVRGIDKGWTVSHLSSLRNGGGRRPLVVYLGDDTSDEAAFRALRGRGLTIRVGRPKQTAARFRLSSPERVLKLLEKVLAASGSSHSKSDRRA